MAGLGGIQPQTTRYFGGLASLLSHTRLGLAPGLHLLLWLPLRVLL